MTHLSQELTHPGSDREDAQLWRSAAKAKVKKLERKRKSSISHPRRRIYMQVKSSNDDLDEEDTSKQGRESDKTKSILTHEEQEKYTIEERARLLAEFFERRKKQLAAQKTRGNKEQTTYKNSSQEQDDYLPQTYGFDQDIQSIRIGTTSTTLTVKLPILNLGDYDLWLMRIEQYFLMTDYSLWEVIKNGNKVLKRTVREIEHEYEPTTAEEKLQKLISQLEIQGEVITQEDMNLKLLRSLPSEWKTHALIWRNKQEIETISLDDLYNNLKICEHEISGSSNTSQNLQNIAFVSSNSTNSNTCTNEADNTAYGISAAHTQSNPTSRDNLSDAVICVFLASQPNSPQLAQEDLEQIDLDDLEEMDLQWEMAMLIIKARRLDVNDLIEIKKTEEEEVLPVQILSQVVDKFKTGLGYNAASSTTASPAVESFVNSSEMLEYQEYNKSISNKGYHAVPSPFTGNFIPRKPDLTFMDEIVKSENMDVTNIVTPSNVKTVESNHESAGVKSNGDVVEPKTLRKNSFRPPVIEDWNSNYDSEVEFIRNVEDKTVRPSTENIKFAKKTVEKVETSKQNKHYPRGNQRN
ncbi:hypothetical protein Tco_0711630 [Tanacetum coccineum]